jgi:hypothetical protein
MMEGFLRGFAPRHDSNEPFYPDRATGHAPAMLNSMGLLSAATVAARVMQSVSHRAGTRVKKSKFDKLVDVLENAIPEEVFHHCSAEAERVLAWLAEAPTTLADEETGVPELDIVRAGDVESRRAIARWAMDEGLDLEAEFYDAERRLWRRVRATPIDLVDNESHLGETLLLDVDSARYELAITDIRWLMPVGRDPNAAGEAELAEILPFPGER